MDEDIAEAKLKESMSPEFLTTLVEAAKVCGRSVDYHELREFVEWCFDVVEKPVPDIDPYEYDDEEKGEESYE